MNWHVHYRAALHALFGAVRPLRIDIALKVTVVTRVGIDETADGAMLVSDLGLDAAPARAIARDDELAFHVNAELRQLVVIAGQSIIRIDQLAGHVAVGRVSVVSRQLPLIARIRVFGDGGFFQLRRVSRRRDQFEQALFRRREEHVEFFEMSVEAP